MEHLVASPACHPEWTADDVFAAYAGLGFRKFEVFGGWAKSSFVSGTDAAAYRAHAARFGLALTSMHFPKVAAGDEAAWSHAAKTVGEAAQLGVRHAILKAPTRRDYIDVVPRILPLLEAAGLVGVVQNHKGTALTTVEDVLEVLEGVRDPRLKVLLEVGHFQAAGIAWRDAYPRLAPFGIDLVHMKDIGEKGNSVPYGTGVVDFRGLFERLIADGYRGNYVVEIEIRETPESTRHLAHALDYLKQAVGPLFAP